LEVFCIASMAEYSILTWIILNYNIILTTNICVVGGKANETPPVIASLSFPIYIGVLRSGDAVQYTLYNWYKQSAGLSSTVNYLLSYFFYFCFVWNFSVCSKSPCRRWFRSFSPSPLYYTVNIMPLQLLYCSRIKY